MTECNSSDLRETNHVLKGNTHFTHIFYNNLDMKKTYQTYISQNQFLEKN